MRKSVGVGDQKTLVWNGSQVFKKQNPSSVSAITRIMMYFSVTIFLVVFHQPTFPIAVYTKKCLTLQIVNLIITLPKQCLPPFVLLQ